MYQNKPYSEDTDSTNANVYQPGPWISLYELENNTGQWLQGLEKLENNSFINTSNELQPARACVISYDGSVINICRNSRAGSYALIEGATAQEGVLLSFENNNL